MKKYLIYLILISLSTNLNADELRIKSDGFEGDDSKGITIFTGNVAIKKGVDELNASKVTIYTNKAHQPIKYLAQGNVKFYIENDTNATYRGRAQKVVYLPEKQKYHFYTDVYLEELGDKKVIEGDEVILSVKDGKASAVGAPTKPVLMIFKIADKNETK